MLETAPPDRGDPRSWCTARLLAPVNNTTNRALVSIDGSAGVWLPFLPGVYTNITTVFVDLDRHAGARVTGPCYAEDPVVVPPAPAPDPDPQPDITVVIRPTWSGTWRSIRSAYDRWNTDRYGGRSTLYQGAAFGSGTLVGLAVYGDQVAALGAASISSIVVTTKLATGSGDVTLQGTPAGSQPGGSPAPTGETATGTAQVALTAAMREAFRTGSAKSLATVGVAYRGTYGTSAADGMALTVMYKRPA